MTLSDCRAGRLRGIVGFGLCLAAYAVHWCAAPAGAAEKPPLVVNVTPGHTKAANVGCGFGDLSDDVYELNITLTPDNIVNAGIDDQTGALWDWYRDEMGEVTDIKKFRAAGVDPNKRFWVVIWAKLRTEGEPGGDPTYWMSISDLDADADTDNDSIANPRTPSESDDEDFAEYPGYQAPPVIRGIVLGVNDDHDEFLPAVHPWGRDAANTTADLTKEGANYNNQSVGLAQIKVKVGVKRAPGDLKFSVPSTIRLFEGELPEAGNKGAAFLGNRRIDSVGEKTYLFYMEGVSPDNDYGFVRFAYDPDGAGTGEAVDTLAFLPVRMDIDVDSDNSGTVDGSDAEDLREAAPGELGMIVPAVDNPGGFGFGKPGVLRGLYSQAVAYMLNDPQRPAVITLKKVSGAGDVRVWKVRQGQEPVLMLDTSVGGGSTTTDGEGHSLFELLGDASDHNILITGKTPGEVLLGLQLTVNGAKVAMDVVRVVSGIDLDVNVDDHPQDAHGIPLASRPQDVTDGDDALEASRGGYLWVNDDNDRQEIPDSTLDMDDDNLPSDVDDDLEPMRVRVPYWKDGTKIVFHVGSLLHANVRIWHERTKNTLLALDASGNATIEAPDPYDADGDGFYWIEGLNGCSSDTVTATFFADATHSVSDTVRVTVFQILSVEMFQNDGQCHAGHSGGPIADFATDPTGQTRSGCRVFPDAIYPGDTVAHNFFTVKAILFPGIPTDSGWHLPVYVKAFDVDHYSTDTTFDDATSSRDTEGHHAGREPNDNRTGYGAAADDSDDPPRFGVAGDTYDIGIRIHEASSDTVQHILASSATEVRWADRVGIENAAFGSLATKSFIEITQPTPCNNWRFAAGCGNSLHNAVRINDDPDDGETLEAIDDQALGLPGGAPADGLAKSTDTLTVWRRLWIERDYMAPVDLLEGDQYKRSAQDNDVNGGQGTTTIETDLNFDYANQFAGGLGMFWDMGFFWDDLLGYGTIVSHPAGVDQPITFAATTPAATDYVYIADDDVINVNLRDGASPKITPTTADLTLFNDRDGFPAACIEAMTRTSNDNIGTFQLYVNTESSAAYSGVAAATRGLSGGADRWAAQIVECFQGHHTSSHDPNTDGVIRGISCPYWITGLTAGSYGGTLVFVEGLRDWAVNSGGGTDSPELRRRRTTLHEVGHVMGGRHTDGGLMQGGTGTDPGSGMFSGESLRRFMLLRDAGP